MLCYSCGTLVLSRTIESISSVIVLEHWSCGEFINPIDLLYFWNTVPVESIDSMTLLYFWNTGPVENLLIQFE